MERLWFGLASDAAEEDNDERPIGSHHSLSLTVRYQSVVVLIKRFAQINGWWVLDD